MGKEGKREKDGEVLVLADSQGFSSRRQHYNRCEHQDGRRGAHAASTKMAAEALDLNNI